MLVQRELIQDEAKEIGVWLAFLDVRAADDNITEGQAIRSLLSCSGRNLVRGSDAHRIPVQVSRSERSAPIYSIAWASGDESEAGRLTGNGIDRNTTAITAACRSGWSKCSERAKCR